MAVSKGQLTDQESPRSPPESSSGDSLGSWVDLPTPSSSDSLPSRSASPEPKSRTKRQPASPASSDSLPRLPPSSVDDNSDYVADTEASPTEASGRPWSWPTYPPLRERRLPSRPLVQEPPAPVPKLCIRDSPVGKTSSSLNQGGETDSAAIQPAPEAAGPASSARDGANSQSQPPRGTTQSAQTRAGAGMRRQLLSRRRSINHVRHVSSMARPLGGIRRRRVGRRKVAKRDDEDQWEDADDEKEE